jgi:two-component system, OmpR family, phosphate regulon response regulator OmpR
MKLLLIDDDVKLGRLLKRYFESYHWTLLQAERPSAGYQLISEQQPDAVILDIMLPEEDGFQVCRHIRKESDIPIIMLTARGEVTDRVVGLELGADDYLAKPFEPRELVARIQTILRRTVSQTNTNTVAAKSSKTEANLLFKGMTIHPLRQEVFIDNLTINLTTSEFKLLMLFASHPGRVFSRDEIMNELRGTEVEIFSRAIDITVSRLRQKLRTKSSKAFIKTVWGTGYRFTGEPL